MSNKRNAAAEKPIPQFRKLSEEEKPPEYMPMITVMLATFGMMMKIKWFSWLALFACISYIVNGKKKEVDVKQVLTSVLISGMSLFLNYFGPNNRPLPVE